MVPTKKVYSIKLVYLLVFNREHKKASMLLAFLYIELLELITLLPVILLEADQHSHRIQLGYYPYRLNLM